MPRRGNVAKRDVLADPVYNSKMVTRLVNSVMYDGKKGVAQKIVYGAFDIIKEKSGNDPLEMFEKALENIMPVLETKSRRVGGANYQVPDGGPPRPAPDPRPALADHLCPRPQRAHHARAAGRRDHGCRATAPAALSRSARIPTRWLRPTRLLHTTDIDLCLWEAVSVSHQQANLFHWDPTRRSHEV